MSDPDNECHVVPAVSSEIGSVSVCSSCGNVHLTLQHLTLRFTPDAFRELTALTVLAQRELDGTRVTRRGAILSQAITH